MRSVNDQAGVAGLTQTQPQPQPQRLLASDEVAVIPEYKEMDAKMRQFDLGREELQ